MSKYDIYKINKNNTARFLLGKSGRRPLFVIGTNPSYATDVRSDRTITKVRRFARKRGYDGFVMMNVYPFRSTKLKGLPKKPDQALVRKNIKIISSFLTEYHKPVVWAAWGDSIQVRPYLLSSLVSLYTNLRQFKINWKHCGALTRSKNPRHPSRLAYSKRFSRFDIAHCIKNNLGAFEQ